MRATELQHLYDYNYWADARVLDTASQSGQEALAKPAGLAQGGMLDTLVHVLQGEWAWRTRCQEGKSPSSLSGLGEFRDLASLRKRWSQEEGAMRQYLSGLNEVDLDRVVRYRSTLDGRDYATPLLQILLHLVNHGTQHRAGVAAELTRAGHSPGDIDYIVYIRRVREFDFGRKWV